MPAQQIRIPAQVSFLIAEGHHYSSVSSGFFLHPMNHHVAIEKRQKNEIMLIGRTAAWASKPGPANRSPGPNRICAVTPRAFGSTLERRRKARALYATVKTRPPANLPIARRNP